MRKQACNDTLAKFLLVHRLSGFHAFVSGLYTLPGERIEKCGCGDMFLLSKTDLVFFLEQHVCSTDKFDFLKHCSLNLVICVCLTRPKLKTKDSYESKARDYLSIK